MSREIHLYIAGGDDSKLFPVLSSGLAMDRLVVLCSGPDGTIGLMEGLERIGFEGIDAIRTDLTDYQRVYDSVRSVCTDYSEKFGDAHFDVNISSGEPVAVAAMVNAVQSFDADLYYIRDGEVVRMRSDDLEGLAELRGKRRVLETFLRFRDSRSYTNRELMGSLSKQGLVHHTKELSRMGLISREGSVKYPVWVLTDKGEQALRRLRTRCREVSQSA